MADAKKATGSKRQGASGGGRPAAGKAPRAGGRLRVTQTRSTSGRPDIHRRTLKALGLRYQQQVIEITDSPAIRGMLFQVRHLVEVTPAGAK